VSETYRGAGVDAEAAAKAVALIGELAAGVSRAEVVEGVGGFAGLFRVSEGRLLAASTDGVGTKLEIARMTGRLDTVGIDLVAMCADDVVCTGAEPLFFLDYLAVGRVIPERVAALVEGISEGCRRAGCALLGGETAEHPGVMPEDQFDMAGFCVGAVQEADLLGPQLVREGDAVIGFSSSGLHANGYSLARKALLGSHELDETPEGRNRSLADELLEPCYIYARDVLGLAKAGLVRSVAHITGGGFHENVPRALPDGLGVELTRGSWSEHPIFSLVQRTSGASDEEMFSTFNMGVGMVLVVAPEHVDEVLERGAPGSGASASRIGVVTARAGVRVG
jgi:phosphoribosylformylglycinamidine cyclo-ligase